MTTPSTTKPDYYRVRLKDGTEVECLDLIEALGLGFSLGNLVKYVFRAGKKHPDALDDLMKARVYLDREIASLKGNQ